MLEVKQALSIVLSTVEISRFELDLNNNSIILRTINLFSEKLHGQIMLKPQYRE